MTPAELAALGPGDVVMTSVGGVLVRARITMSFAGGYHAWVRREGLARSGRVFAQLVRSACELSLPPKFDPATANVYADWLEEHGEPRAAHALRIAFPLDDGSP